MTDKEKVRRHKICANCNVEFCDVTKRYTGKCCTRACSYSLMSKTRKQNNSYVRTNEQNKKMVETTRQRYGSFASLQTEKSKKKNSLANKQARSSGIVLSKTKATNIERYGVENVFQSPEIKEKIRHSNIKKYGVDHWAKTSAGKDVLSKRASEYQASLTFEERSAQAKERWVIRPISTRENHTTYGNGGKRKDLDDQYFRSNWEANIARILTLIGTAWEYEPKQFIFNDKTTYTPDFSITSSSLTLYIEVKGYEDKDYLAKWVKFCKYVDDLDNVAYVLISASRYNKLRKQFKKYILWEGR